MCLTSVCGPVQALTHSSNTHLCPNMDLFMRTIHVYVPTTEQDRYHSPVSDRLFLISATAAFLDVTTVPWMDVCGSIPGAKSAVVEFCLRAAHGEQGLGVWLCTWPLRVETLRRCSQVSMRPTHKSAAHASFPLPTCSSLTSSYANFMSLLTSVYVFMHIQTVVKQLCLPSVWRL